MKAKARLYCDSITAEPVTVDWSRPYGDSAEEGDGWRSWEPCDCDECGATLILEAGMGEEEHRHLDREAECMGRVEQASGPLMNFYYPLPNSERRNPEELAEAIAGLPLCVVQLPNDDGYGLALTGGGMDLSWEICAGYVACGYYPPTHFARLPRMGGRGTSPSDRRLIARCKESFRIAGRWASEGAKRLAQDFPPPAKVQKTA